MRSDSDQREFLPIRGEVPRRYVGGKNWLKAVLIILVLGIMSMGISAKGCNPWEKDDTTSGSSGVGPFDLIATAVSSSQIDLTWKHDLNPIQELEGTGFELQRKTGAEGTYQTIATLGLVTSYQDSPLSPTTTYYYRVSAYHTVGGSKVQFSNWSNEAWANTQTIPTWTSTTTTDAPAARAEGHSAVWTGTKMIVWGGHDGSGGYFNTGGIYDPVTDSWAPTSLTNTPSARSYHTAIWTGTKIIVWGGIISPSVEVTNTGGIYDPIADTWTPITTTNAPSARTNHTAVWTGTEMIVWGGYDGGSFNDGAKYYPITDTWVTINTVSAPSSRWFNIAVWTGSKMIVWGGYDGASYLNTGGVYDPVIDTWTPTSTTNAPSGRLRHTAVWTGTQMIIWGGIISPSVELTNTGGIYDPVANTWTPTSTTNAPSARYVHTAVWTGSRMIVWAGSSTNTGGIYDPSIDTWVATLLTNAPSGRGWHTAIWTGPEMIVWGGTGFGTQNTGGRYKP